AVRAKKRDHLARFDRKAHVLDGLNFLVLPPEQPAQRAEESRFLLRHAVGLANPIRLDDWHRHSLAWSKTLSIVARLRERLTGRRTQLGVVFSPLPRVRSGGALNLCTKIERVLPKAHGGITISAAPRFRRNRPTIEPGPAAERGGSAVPARRAVFARCRTQRW